MWAEYSDFLAVGSAGSGQTGIDSPLRLFRNARSGTFEAVDLPGLSEPFGALDITAGDVDGDGLPDLLLASGSLGHNRLATAALLLNRADKTFEVGAQFPSAQAPVSSTGVSTVDIDQDGRPEIYLAGDGAFGESDYGRSYLLTFGQ